MTAVTVQKQTAEPGKRVIRTVLAWVIGLASATPVIAGAIVLPKGTELGVVVTDVVAVSTGITALMANPTINKALTKIGLGATTVTKLKTATLAAADPITPAIEAAIQAALEAQKQLEAGDVAAAVETAGTGAADATTAVQNEVPLVEAAVTAGS